MAVYIQAATAISPQDTFRDFSSGKADFRSITFEALPGKGFFNSVHPDFKQYINPTALRRMSPIIRMGLATAKVCLEQAGLDKPDAILVGTGLGCVRDTAKFLNQVIDNGELLLNPTAFIQSTHNTVSGQIALMLGCRAHNLTFSQNSLSFENALLEGMMLMEEGKQDILLGGSDEIVEDSYQLMKENDCVSGPMGEGSNFFVLSSECSEKSLARVDGLEIQNRKLKPDELVSKTHTFLASFGLLLQDVDFLLSGDYGNEQRFPADHMLGYKHLVGEYNTASAFAMWLAAQIIGHNHIPDGILLHGESSPSKPVRRILLLNQNKGRDYSWILLSHPDT